MIRTFQRPFARNLFVGALAVVGTVASFSLTAAPAQAQSSASYSAVLAKGLDAPVRKVVNGAVWNCTGDQCTGRSDGSSPVNTCARVAKEFGQITKFATPKGELSADKLARCNAAA
ncbi:hypothetical protein [Novosphingobium sp.]|uniref:CC_3452 family protein n=1 Tax=Novosphingobium sp. TaxID=1874826 RepID=UPI0035ADFA98